MVLQRLSRLSIVPLLLAASGAHAALRVVATTPEYAAVASAVGGDKVSVSYLAKPTEDPHFVDAKPSHLVALNRADVLVEGGADLEVGWLPPLVQESRNPRIAPGGAGRVAASEGIQLLDVPASLDRSKGDLHAAGNPHFMMDPENAGIVAHHLADVFCRLDTGSCAVYQANRERFEKTLDERMKIWMAKLSPFKGTPVVTYHSTWRYFAARFGLVSDTYLEPKPGIPPSPPHLAEVIAKMNDLKIRVILVEPHQNRKQAEVLAEHTGGTVVNVCQFPGGLPGTDGDFFALMDADVRAIASALASRDTP
jgi:zinc/manganese transport system substrate-binding protein